MGERREGRGRKRLGIWRGERGREGREAREGVGRNVKGGVEGKERVGEEDGGIFVRVPSYATARKLAETDGLASRKRRVEKKRGRQ